MPLNFSDTEKQYNALFERTLSRRDQILAFKSFLEKETTWLMSPASTRFHLCVEHGLLIHSVGVTENALKIKDLLAPDITDESVIVAALFHDVGKLGLPGKPYYLPNDNRWEIEKRGIAYKVNPELVTMNLAVRSLQLVSRFIPLTEEESRTMASIRLTVEWSTSSIIRGSAVSR